MNATDISSYYTVWYVVWNTVWAISAAVLIVMMIYGFYKSQKQRNKQ